MNVMDSSIYDEINRMQNDAFTYGFGSLKIDPMSPEIMKFAFEALVQVEEVRRDRKKSLLLLVK